MTLQDVMRRTLGTRNEYLRCFMAEFLGTFVLMAFGDASVAQYKLGEPDFKYPFLSVNWAWGIAVMMGVWVSAGVSGGHINPAVSLAMAIVGNLSWVKLPIYIAAQYLGSLAASGVVYGLYIDAINTFDGGVRMVYGSTATAGIWATYPTDNLRWHTGLGDQIFGTLMLVLCVFAVTDKRNSAAPKGMVPFAVGLIVAVIGMSLGLNCGYAINPARDLGPRLFTLMAGWGTDVFKYKTDLIAEYNWFWIPIVGPHVGAILGAFAYLLLVGIHCPDEEETDEAVSLDDVELKVKPKVNNTAANNSYDYQKDIGYEYMDNTPQNKDNNPPRDNYPQNRGYNHPEPDYEIPRDNRPQANDARGHTNRAYKPDFSSD